MKAALEIRVRYFKVEFRENLNKNIFIHTFPLDLVNTLSFIQT
jgi:hypothetical protein